MKLLIVGAGAVGSAYGYYAQKGGAKVSYLVKPQHLEKLKTPFRLYEFHGLSKTPRTINFTPDKIYSSQSEAMDDSWDYVLITTPSDALRVGTWLEELVAKIGRSTLISLQPGHDDQNQILAKGLKKQNLISGSIPLLSYWAPLPGDKIEKPGYAFWLPPTTAATWSGESPKIQEIINLFTRGGLKSIRKDTNTDSFVFGETLLRMVVLGLEKSNWTFDSLIQTGNLERVSRAIRETIPVGLAMRGLPVREANFIERLVTAPVTLKAIIHVASAIAPFSFDGFLKIHFTKVNKQMDEGLQELFKEATVRKIQNSALRELSNLSTT